MSAQIADNPRVIAFPPALYGVTLARRDLPRA